MGDYDKVVKEIITLSRIRELEHQTEKQVSAMPITYAIEIDYLYKKGIAAGLQEGFSQGVEKRARQVAVLLLQSASLSLE
ncbi:MAG: hypothetical protein HC842_00740 [Cytophagales bacterium]|nr:hypothetical protein [Cytophagales bacterium]